MARRVRVTAGVQELITEMPTQPVHTPRGLIGKVGGIDYGAGIGPLVEQALTCHAGEGGVLVGEEGRVRPYELDRVVHDIAGEGGLLAAALGIDDDAAGRVPGRILKPDAVFNLTVHAVVTLHDVGQSRIHNG